MNDCHISTMQVRSTSRLSIAIRCRSFNAGWTRQTAGIKLAEAMTLATATPDGKPSARLVLLKQADERGFVFFTNYNSMKARELDSNPQAALVFYWPQLERQVRIEGKVERVSAAESDAYFKTRPRESQIGALASPQSEVIASRERCNKSLMNLRSFTKDAKSNARRIGAATACRLSELSFGKAGRAGCTIALFTNGKRMVLGLSNVWLLSRKAAGASPPS